MLLLCRGSISACREVVSLMYRRPRSFRLARVIETGHVYCCNHDAFLFVLLTSTIFFPGLVTTLRAASCVTLPIFLANMYSVVLCWPAWSNITSCHSWYPPDCLYLSLSHGHCIPSLAFVYTAPNSSFVVHLSTPSMMPGSSFYRERWPQPFSLPWSFAIVVCN